MNAITRSLKAKFDGEWGLLVKIIDVCPDSVWSKKAGGDVFWQQIYHCFACVDYFLMPKGGSFDAGPLGMDVVMLKTEPSSTLSKDEVKAFGAKMKAKADAWIDSLDDAALVQPNGGQFAARTTPPMDNVTVLAVMTGHSSYHVGHCDAILRDNGVKGVM